MNAMALLMAMTAMLACFGCAEQAAPVVGTQAPSFTLPSQDGSKVSLTDFRDKWLVLFFYPADFSEAGLRQVRAVQADLPQYAKANAVVVGVSSTEVQSKKDLTNAEHLTFPLLSDTDKSVSKRYGSIMSLHYFTTYSARNTFIIDPTGKIARVLLDVDSRTHSQQVLDALRELQKR